MFQFTLQKSNDLKKSEMPTTLADLTAACGEKILNPDFLLQGGGQPFAEQQKLNNNQQHLNDTDTTNGTDNGKSVTDKAENNLSNITSGQSISPRARAPTTIPPVIIDEEDPIQFMLKRPIITLYSQKMKGLKDLLLAEKLNTHAISLQVTAQSVASKKVRGVDKLGNQTTNSTYSTVNVSNTTDSSTAGDSIAVSRPKRTRRE